MVVHPAAGNWSGTLLNALLARHPQSAALPRAGIVHRLDKDTSGLMVVGKTLAAVTALLRAIAAREVHRATWRSPTASAPAAPFSVEAPIGRDRSCALRMAVVASAASRRGPTSSVLGGDARLSALRCKLHTGRTHQIRVHLARTGLPLVADRALRRPAGAGHDAPGAARCRAGFAHPRVGRAPRVRRSPPPADLAPAWQRLGVPRLIPCAVIGYNAAFAFDATLPARLDPAAAPSPSTRPIEARSHPSAHPRPPQRLRPDPPRTRRDDMPPADVRPRI